MLLYLLLALPLESCAQAPRSISEKGSIPIPEAAYDVERHSLESESAYQIDFKINAVYPDTKAANFYTELFSEYGWHACTNNDEWVEYGKRIGNETDVPTRQKLQYLASTTEKKLLLVALRYSGYQETGKIQSRKWDNEVQQVTVVLYDLRGKDFDKTLSLLSLRCGS